MPPEPPAAQDLRDLYEACWAESPTYGDTETIRLMGLWDAEVSEVAAYITTLCGEEKSAPIVAILEENPHIFNYLIIYNASDALLHVNHELNIKIDCTETISIPSGFC